MARNIDDKVVNMEFNNKNFEKNVQTSMSTLEKLKKSLNFEDSTKSLSDLEKKANALSLNNIASGVESLASRFSTLGIIGMRVIENITDSVMNLVGKVKNFVLTPLTQGGFQRALNIEQAKFQFKGLGIAVEEAMKSANDAVTDTAFGLDEAAKAAAQFGASGMAAGEDMTRALRAISGVAAMTSSSYTEIADIFTTVSGNGRLMTQQLRQLSSRGLNVAATLAKEFGKTEAEIRDMVTKGTISFEMFYEAMDNAFGEHAKAANETFSGSLANVKANFSRMGADVAAQGLESFKNVNNALIPVLKGVHTALKPVIEGINGFIDSTSKKIIVSLEATDLTFFEKTMVNVVAIFSNLGKIITSVTKPMKEAFKDVFPQSMSETISKITAAVADFTSKMALTEQQADKVKNAFRGIFSVIGIVAKGLSAVVEPALIVAGVAFNVFLEVASVLGNLTYTIVEFINKTGILDDVIRTITGLFRWFGGVSDEIFENFGIQSGNLNEAVRAMGDAFADFYNRLKNSGLGTLAEGIINVFKFLGEGIKIVIKSIGSTLSELSFGDFGDLFSGLSISAVALLIYNRLKKSKGMLDTLKDTISSFKGLSKSFTVILDSLRTTLEAYQNKLKANTLKQIAIAIGILTASVLVLSLIDPEKMSNALVALSGLFAQLMISMKIFAGSIKDMPKTASAIALMLGMSTAILILSGAMKSLSELDTDAIGRGLIAIGGLMLEIIAFTAIMNDNQLKLTKGTTSLIAFGLALKIMASVCKDLATLEWEEIGKGLTGVSGLVLNMVVFLKFAKLEKGLISTASGLVLLGAAMKILASACKDFGTLDWNGLDRGLVAMGGILLMLGQFTHIASGSKKMVSIGVGMIAIAGSMKIFASAMEDIAKFNWEEIAKGLSVFGGALLTLGLTTKLLPERSMIGVGIGLAIIAASMGMLADALIKMGSFNDVEFERSLTVFATSLYSLVLALNLMENTLKGSAALLIASSAIGLLTISLKAMGNLEWENIIKSLVTLGGALLIITVAGTAVSTAIGPMLALGASIALIGVGAIGMGAGLLLAAGAVNLLVVALEGLAGMPARVLNGVINTIKLIGQTIIEMIPNLAKAMALGLVEMIKVIGDSAEAFAQTFKKLLLSFVDVIAEAVPHIAEAFLKMIDETLKALVKFIPSIVDSVMSIIIKVIQGVAARLPELVSAIADLFRALIDSVINEIGGIDVEGLIKGIVAIGALSGLMLALSTIAGMVPAAMLGVLGAGVVIAELALVLGAIGLLAQIPGLKWAIDEGADLLEGIGTAIGRFVGGIVGGIGAGIASSLPAIGQSLSDFFTNGKPFFDGVSSLDSGVVDSVKTLAEAILIITAAEVLDSLVSWLTGTTSFEGFAKGLEELGKGISSFAEEVRGIDGNTVVAGAEAGKILGSMAKDLPKEGGVWQFFAGAVDLDKFAKGLKGFGKGIKDFGEEVRGIDGNTIKAGSEAGKTLAEAFSSIPNSNGLWQFFTGEVDMNKFAKDLVNFGQAIVGFADSINKNIDLEFVKNAAEAGVILADMVNKIPNSGGLWQFFTGSVDIENFGKDLESFGRSLMTFSREVSAGIDNDAILSATEAGKALADMANAIPNSGGMWAFFAGDNNINDFGKNLVLFGGALSNYALAVKGIDVSAINESTLAVSYIVNLAKKISDESLDSSGFGSLMYDFGTSLKAMHDNLVTVNHKDLLNALASLDEVVKALSKIQELDPNGAKSLKNAMRDLAETNINGFIQAFDNGGAKVNRVINEIFTNMERSIAANEPKLKLAFEKVIDSLKPLLSNKETIFQDLGGHYIRAIVSGVKDNESIIAPAFIKAINSAVKNIRDTYMDFYRAGEYVVSGFVGGINDNAYKAATAAKAMANAAANAAKKALDEHSPSRVFYKIGAFAGDGFVNAMTDYIGIAADAGSKMAQGAIDSVIDVLGLISDVIDSDVELEPVIKPVLDLTDVSNNAGELNSLFGLQSYQLATSIAQIATPVSITDAVNEAVNATVNAIKGGDEPEDDSKLVIEVPVIVDGREIAKATAEPMNKELERINKINSRKGGYQG